MRLLGDYFPDLEAAYSVTLRQRFWLAGSPAYYLGEDLLLGHAFVWLRIDGLCLLKFGTLIAIIALRAIVNRIQRILRVLAALASPSRLFLFRFDHGFLLLQGWHRARFLHFRALSELPLRAQWFDDLGVG